MAARDTNKLVGIFLMVHGGMQALLMLFLVLIYGVLGVGMATTARKADEQTVGVVFLVIALVVAVFSALFIIPQLLGGWKILKEKPNARTWGIIGSIVACLSFPLGTAAGVFGLVFLFGDEGKQFYLGGNSYSNNAFPPPPPNNWQ
ncbi:MAG: hypothetical protein WA584_03880 [Pyrinomonadaceae bacterium]